MRFVFLVLSAAAVTAFAGKVAADPLALSGAYYGFVL